jgi:hypothetical protein
MHTARFALPAASTALRGDVRSASVAWMSRPLGSAILLGIALGAFSLVGDLLPADTPLVVLVAMANAIGPWLAVAFVAGAIGGSPRGGAIGGSPRGGAIAGSLALVAGVLTYYAGVQVVWGAALAEPGRATVAWGAVALVTGATVGAAGGAWSDAAHRWRSPAVGALVGLLLAEGAARFIEVEGWTGLDFGRTALQVWAVDGAAAILAPLLLLRRQRLLAYGSGIVVALISAAAVGFGIAMLEDLISA